MSDEQKIPEALAKAIAAVQGKIQAAHKSGENKFDHYMYSTLDDYMVALRPLMAEAGVWFTFSLGAPETPIERKTAAGKTEYYIRLQVTMRVGCSSGEYFEISGWGEGQDRGDKAIYKATTGAKKYLVSNAFSIPTTDDPETDSHETEPEKSAKSAEPHQNAGKVPTSSAKPDPKKSTPQTAKSYPGKDEPRFITDNGVRKLNPDWQAYRGLVTADQIRQIKIIRDLAVKDGGYTAEDHYRWVWKTFFIPNKVKIEKPADYLFDLKQEWFQGVIEGSKSIDVVMGKVAMGDGDPGPSAGDDVAA